MQQANFGTIGSACPEPGGAKPDGTSLSAIACERWPQDQPESMVPTASEPIPRLGGRLGLKLLYVDTPAKTIPRMTDAEMAETKAVARDICGWLEPARPEEIAILCERLALHYPAMGRTAREARLVAEDWIEDLSEYPADLVHEACRLWRNSTQRFMPTSGQLMEPIKPIWNYRVALGKRARAFLEAAQ